MNSNVFTTVRFVLAVGTVLAIIGKPHLPPETLLLHPSADTHVGLYSAGVGTESSANWVDEEAYASRCEYEPIDGGLNCGISLSWGLENPGCLIEVGRSACMDSTSDPDGDGWGWEGRRICRIEPSAQKASAQTPTASAPEASAQTPTGASAPLESSRCRFAVSAADAHNPATAGANSTLTFPRADGIDFSRYDGLNLSVQYSGRAGFLRLFLINRNPEGLREDRAGPGKFMSAYVQTDDLKAGPAYVDLSEFSVAEWWILMTDAPRALATPEYDQIFALGIDHVETGVHNLAIDRVELVGERISWEHFLLLLAAFWAGVLLLEGVIRYYTLNELSRSRRQRIAELSELFTGGELLTSTGPDGSPNPDKPSRDELTGLCSRAGIAQQLGVLEEDGQVPPNLGILLIDIDQFKRINDIYGRDTGDQALREVARTLASKVRDGDILARWGGEEFILIIRNISRDRLIKMAEKLRTLMAETVFDADKAVRLTVSIGATSARSGDSFALTLKRVDVAMYRAKSIRNSIAYE